MRKQAHHIAFPVIYGNAPPAANVTQRLEAMQGWVYACVSAIAEEIANVDFKLMQMTNGEIVELEEGDALDLLYKVNPFQTKADFLKLHQTYMELTGECFWFLERGKENPKPTDPIKELWILRPDLVDVVPDANTFIKGYIYRMVQKTLTFQPFEVIHFKYPNPINPYRGLSPVQAAALSIDTERYSSEWNRNFFYNSARPDGVLIAKGGMKDDEYERLSREWEAQHQGTDRAHRIAILEGDLEYTQMQISQKDMDFMRQKEMTRDEILGIWRVPKTVLGITQDVTVSNAEATNYVFSSRVVKPKMQALVETLNEFLMPLYGDNLYLDFDDPTPENRVEKINEYVQGFNRWLTTNEIRSAEGLPPVDGGDSLYQSIAMMPFGEVSADGETTDETEAGTEGINADMVVLKAPKARNYKADKKYKISRKKLLAGNKKRKAIEAMRRKIELLVEKKQSAEQKDVSQAKQEAVAILTETGLELERDFYKSELDKTKKDLMIVEEKKEIAEKLAADALELKQNDTAK